MSVGCSQFPSQSAGLMFSAHSYILHSLNKHWREPAKEWPGTMLGPGLSEGSRADTAPSPGPLSWWGRRTWKNWVTAFSSGKGPKEPTLGGC